MYAIVVQCGSGHINPAVHTQALGQSINLDSAFSLGYYCLNSAFSGPMRRLGLVAQSVTCLETDASLTADPGVASLILARSHTFVEIMK